MMEMRGPFPWKSTRSPTQWMPESIQPKLGHYSLMVQQVWGSTSSVLDWISEAKFGLKSVSRPFHLRPLMCSLCSMLFDSRFFFFFFLPRWKCLPFLDRLLLCSSLWRIGHVLKYHGVLMFTWDPLLFTHMSPGCLRQGQIKIGSPSSYSQTHYSSPLTPRPWGCVQLSSVFLPLL